MVESLSSFLQRNETETQRQKVGAAQLVLGSIEASPDEVAGDLRIAQEYGKATGAPVPPVEMVKDYRSTLLQKIEERKNQTILSTAPRLTDWLQDPKNASLAKDTLPELSWWEGLGKQVKETGKAVPGGAINSAGLAMEGAGQLMTPDNGGQTIDLKTRISQAQSKTPEEIAVLRQDIFKQGGINPAYAQSILSDVLDGSLRPEDAMSAFAPALKEVSAALQQSGVAVQDYSSTVLPAEKGMEESIGRQVGGGLGSLITILGVGWMTGGLGAAAFGGASGAGEATARARKAGQDEDTQTLAAVWGTLPGMTDAIPIERILSNPVLKAGLGHFFRSVGKQALIEGGQEAVQQVLQNLIAKTLYEPQGNVMKDVADNFATGGLVGGLVDAARLAVIAALPGRIRGGQTAAAEAPATAATIAEVSQNAQGSVLRERSPDTFRQYVEQATGGEPVENIFVPADKFVEYFQGIGVDPFALIDEIDGLSRSDLDAALESGDLKIPTAAYAAKLAGTEYDQFFQENGRFSPDGMSMTEAQEFEVVKNDLMQEAWEEAENARVEDEMLRPVEDQIRDELITRLRVEGRGTDEAQTIAQVITDHYRVTAAEQGITTSEYLARYPLPQFRGSIPQGMQPKNVDAFSRILAEARLRKPAAPKTAPSLLEFISEYGGIANDRGELRARNAEVIKRGKGKKTLRLRRSTLKDGMGSLFGSDAGKKFGADDVALAAIDAGFMADNPVVQEYRAAMEEGRETPDLTRALWDEIDNELRDGPRPAADASGSGDYLDDIENYLSSLNVSLSDDDAKIRAAAEADQASEGLKYGQMLFQDASSGPRGSIAFPTAGTGKGDTIIRTFETANLSTILHELGHMFLTMTQADAARGIPTAIAKMDAAKAWWRSNASDVAKDAMRVMPDVTVTAADVEMAIDAGTTGDVMKDAAIDIGMQEQTARGFEAYLFEGKAPSAGMRDLFARMSAWLVRVYRRVTALDVKLDDKIRSVFDRMLATEDEIAAAQRDLYSEHPLFASAEEMGLTQEQYQKLMDVRRDAENQAKTRLLAKVMEPEKRAREAWFKEERAKVRAEVEAEFRQSRTYRSIQEIRFGKNFDGEEVPALKMSREVIEREFGAGYVPFLPGTTKDGHGHKNAVFTNDGGVHPDIAAGAYGFRSGSEMLDAMTQAPAMDEAIEAETDKTMRERHGDVMNDGTLEAEAMDAVHNDKRGEWIAAELKAVQDVAGVKVGLTLKEARAAARTAAGRMAVRDATNASRFLAAERKAGAEAARLGAMLARDKVWLDAARRKISTAARAAIRGEANPELAAKAIEEYNARFATTESTYEVAEQQRVSSKGKAFTIPAGERTSTNLGYNDLVAKLSLAKRRQLMNHALYMEARQISEKVDKTAAKLSKLGRANSRQVKTRNLDHVMAARAIAARFGLARPDTQFDFDAWVTQLQEDDPGMAAAMGQAITTYANAPVKYRDLTVDQFNAISDAIENILETGKRYKMLEIDGQTVEREAAISELTAVLEARGSKPNEALKARLTDAQKNGRSALSMLSALRRMENWARDMDDGEQGVFTRYLVRPVMQAVDIYRAKKAETLTDLLAVINPRKEDLLGGVIEALELGYTFQNKGELLHAILHTGNDSNKEKLLIGRGWSEGLTGQEQAVSPTGKLRTDKQGNPIMTRGSVDTSKWDAFIARMISQGKITKEDFDTAQAIWDLNEKLKRPAQSAHRKMFGYYFDEVEASPVETPFGTYRGGYVPAIADTDASNDGQLRADQAAMEAQQTSFMFPTTGKGFTKARVQNYHTPLALNLMLLPAHMDKVLRFTHIEPTIRQTASLVTNREMRGALDAFDRSIAPNLITPWLQRTAQQAVETQPATPAGRAFSAVVRGFRTRVGVHTMFANLVNTAQQVTGFASAAILVKPTNLKKALVSFSMGNAAEMRATASEKSGFMRDRIEMVGRETQRRIQDVITEPTKMGAVRSWVDEHGYFMQTGTQNLIDVITWHAAYDQSIGRGMSEGDAVFEADSVIRRTMGDFSPENVSMFETGSAFTRLFTMFASYFNGQANLIGGEMQTVMRTMGWAGTPRMFHIYLMGVAIPAIVGEMIVQAAKGELLDDDDDDGYLDEIAELFFGSQAKYMTGMVPVAGQVANAVIARFNSQVYDDGIAVSPVVPAIEKTVSAPFSVADALFDDGSAKKAVSDSIVALGLVTGVPTNWLAKSAGYLTGVAEGTSSPDGVVDIARGLVSGRDGSEK